MALQAPIKRASICSSCQRWILGSFVAAVGGQTVPVRRVYRTPQRRLFSRTAREVKEDRERLRDDALPLNDINDSAAEQHAPKAASTPTQPTPSPSTQDDAHLPWYLRLQSPLPEQSSPISSKQVLPDLPSNPPPLLQPLLEHVSTQLGMDSLTLLDLRNLDPPPALGSNLLMLIGTARSERHLHVSSDKLCRWLRTEYKLSPHADGLLGRGELKILMRRKAKRRRLLSAVNAGKGVGVEGTGEGEVEDGVRTGWVCVNIGLVEGGEGQARETIPSEGVIGFGPAVEGGGAGGCSIVVQLMTEEKRAEVDLERLWEGVLAKDQKERERLREHVGMGAVEVEAVESVMMDENSVQALEQGHGSTTSRFEEAMPAVSNQSSTQQLRAYHTTSRRPAPLPALSTLEPEQEARKNDDMTLPSPSASVAPATDTISSQPSEPPLQALKALFATLKSLPRKEAVETLGPNVLQASEHLNIVPAVTPVSPMSGQLKDRNHLPYPVEVDSAETTTPFLEKFYTTMPPFPASEHWHVHVELLAHARMLGVREMHSPVLVAQVKNMLISGLIPARETFLLVIRSILSPLGAREGSVGDVEKISNNKKRDVLGLLEDMEVCGYDSMSDEVSGILSGSFGGNSKRKAAEMMDFNTLRQTIELARLRRLANTRDWPAFWRTWRSYPQRFLPRSAAMYIVLFESIADGKLVNPNVGERERVIAAREAKETVWACLEEMEMEDPVVEVGRDVSGELARAVKGAVAWCEPGLMEEGTKGIVAREWKEWWERCGRVLKATPNVR